MVFGRFVLGISCGVLLCATSKLMDETIPAKLIDQGFGTSTNILINVSAFFLLVMALWMPSDSTQLQQSKFWMIIYGSQVPLQILTLVLYAFFFKEEPIDFSVKRGDKRQAISLISKVYSSYSKEDHEAIYYEKRRIAKEAEKKKGLGSQDSLYHSLTDPSQRSASWMCIFISLFGILSGNGIINMYSTAIFDGVSRMGSNSPLSSKQQN
jgi:MFS family permease